jgi:hypothetical protein
MLVACLQRQLVGVWLWLWLVVAGYSVGGFRLGQIGMLLAKFYLSINYKTVATSSSNSNSSSPPPPAMRIKRIALNRLLSQTTELES